MKSFFLLAMFLFIVSSCSLFKTRKLQKTNWQDMQRRLDSSCLLTPGSGRTKTSFRSLSFDYESWVKKKTVNTWNLAMDFAMHGEELLRLSWRDDRSKMAIGGSFQKKYLSKTIRTLSEKYNRKPAIMMKAMQDLGFAARVLIEKKWNCRERAGASFQCQKFTKQYNLTSYRDEVELSLKSTDDILVTVTLSKYKNNRPHRFTFSLTTEHDQNLLTLDMLSEQCQRS